MGKISNYYFLSDNTRLFYRNTIDMLLLTHKLNPKCYVLYETKELLTVTKIYIISIAMTIAIIIIIIIIIITITVITISIIILFVKSTWRIC